jgi:hypothetical protein
MQFLGGNSMSPKILIIEGRGAIANQLKQEAESCGFLVDISHSGEGGKQCFLKKRISQEEFDIISISTPLSLRPFEIQNEKVSSFIIDYFARKNYQGTILHCIGDHAHRYEGSYVELPFSLNETIVQHYGYFGIELIKKWGHLCKENIREEQEVKDSENASLG